MASSRDRVSEQAGAKQSADTRDVTVPIGYPIRPMAAEFKELAEGLDSATERLRQRALDDARTVMDIANDIEAVLGRAAPIIRVGYRELLPSDRVRCVESGVTAIETVDLVEQRLEADAAFLSSDLLRVSRKSLERARRAAEEFKAQIDLAHDEQDKRGQALVDFVLSQPDFEDNARSVSGEIARGASTKFTPEELEEEARRYSH